MFWNRKKPSNPVTEDNPGRIVAKWNAKESWSKRDIIDLVKSGNLEKYEEILDYHPAIAELEAEFPGLIEQS